MTQESQVSTVMHFGDLIHSMNEVNPLGVGFGSCCCCCSSSAAVYVVSEKQE